MTTTTVSAVDFSSTVFEGATFKVSFTFGCLGGNPCSFNVDKEGSSLRDCIEQCKKEFVYFTYTPEYYDSDGACVLCEYAIYKNGVYYGYLHDDGETIELRDNNRPIEI